MSQKMKAKQLNKATRMKVYNKYDGHCAYCGCPLEFSEMQVDHLIPLYWAEELVGKATVEEVLDFKNLMPSCRACNFYKGTSHIDQLRHQLETLPQRLEGQFGYKLAKKYGIITESKQPIKFYFEQVEGEK